MKKWCSCCIKYVDFAQVLVDDGPHTEYTFCACVFCANILGSVYLIRPVTEVPRLATLVRSGESSSMEREAAEESSSVERETADKIRVCLERKTQTDQTRPGMIKPRI